MESGACDGSEEHVRRAPDVRCPTCITTGSHSDGWWPRRVVLGRGNPGVDENRLGFGLVKEIVAGVLFPSGLG